MPSLSEIMNDPNFVKANAATKRAIFEKWAPQDPNYKGANGATQAAIRAKAGVDGGGAAPVEEPKEAPKATASHIGGLTIGSVLKAAGDTLGGVVDTNPMNMIQNASSAGARWIRDHILPEGTKVAGIGQQATGAEMTGAASDIIHEKAGIPQPIGDKEKLYSEGMRAVAGALMTGSGGGIKASLQAGEKVLPVAARKTLELGSAALSGVAGEKVRQMNGGPAAQIAASMLAGTGPHLVASGTKQATSLANKHLGRGPESGYERASERLHRALATDSDPNALPTALHNLDRQSESHVPGVQPTLADASQAPGLAALQRQSHSTDLQGRQYANAQARLEHTATQFGEGDPNAVNRLARTEQDVGTRAERRARERIGNVSDPVTEANKLRDAYDPAYTAAKEKATEAYQHPILQRDAPLDPRKMGEGSLQNKLRKLADDFYFQGKANDELRKGNTLYSQIIDLVDGNNLTNKSYTNLTRRLRDKAGEAFVSGKTDEGNFIKELRRAVEEHVDPALPNQYKRRLADANAVRRNVATTFEEGRVGQAVKETRYGSDVTQDPELIGKIMPQGDKGQTAALELKGAVPGAAEDLVRNRMRRLVEENKVKMDPRYSHQYSPLTKEFPAVDADINAFRAHVAKNKEFPGTALGKMLTEADPETAIAGLLRDASDKPFKALRDSVLNSGNERAIEGFKKAMARHVADIAEKGGATDKTGARVPGQSPEAIQTILKRTEGTSIFTDAQREALGHIEKELRIKDFSETGGVYREEYTDRNIPGVKGSTARMIRFLIDKMHNDKQMGAAVHKAMLDPKFASELLRRPTADRMSKVLRQVRIGARASMMGAIPQKTDEELEIQNAVR